MAKRRTKPAETDEVEKGPMTHFVRYTDENGQNIEASFPSDGHADVLRSRLKAHGIPHDYEAPSAE